MSDVKMVIVQTIVQDWITLRIYIYLLADVVVPSLMMFCKGNS